MLAEVSGEPARTYSIGFEAEGFDEMAYARIAARHFGTRRREYYVMPDDMVIGELTSKHVQDHADCYGTMVWVLMVLEQWLRQHRIAEKGGVTG